MKKVINVLFIMIFMALLLVPLVNVDFNGGSVSERENRVLASRPAISSIGSQTDIFIRQFDDWFSDNIGFREKMLDAYSYVGKLENNVQYTNGRILYVVGEEGHHFQVGLTNGKDIEKYQGRQYVSDSQMQGMVDGINKAKTYLDERGIPLIVMFCTDKETIYQEYFPKSIIFGGEPVQLDIITDYVKSHSDVDLFNIRQRFMAEKENYLTYFRRRGDLAHYNEVGAFLAYQELMEHINAYIPGIKMLTTDDIEVIYSTNDGYTDSTGVNIKRELPYERLDNEFFGDLPYVEPHLNFAYENDDANLPTILFMKDSYSGHGTFLSRYIPFHFGRTILIQYTSMQHFEQYIEHFSPDIVVFESAERALRAFANSMTTYSNVE